jgi:hypothetical protein
MKMFLIGLILGVPFGMIAWGIKKRLKKVQQIDRNLTFEALWESKKVEKNLDTKLSEIAKSGRLPEFLDFLERETPPIPRMDDLHKIYREQEKREKMNKKLQKWVDSL